MVDQDQNIRRILVDSVGIDSPNARPFIKRMMSIDADNQKNIRLILNRYGWIGLSKIGTKAAEAFFYTIQHSDTTLMIKWFPEFKRLADIGEADKVECAMMEDRLLMWKGKKQIYGTQATVFREDKKVAIWPIEDPKNVNERRQKIGFALTVEANFLLVVLGAQDHVRDLGQAHDHAVFFLDDELAELLRRLEVGVGDEVDRDHRALGAA